MGSRSLGGKSAPAGSKTVCHRCGHDAVAAIGRQGFCNTHYEAEIGLCGTRSPHDWVLDSTEVFTETLEKPVVRAFYMCTRCGAGVVAKPGEAPEEAAMARLKEGLLRIERMLE